MLNTEGASKEMLTKVLIAENDTIKECRHRYAKNEIINDNVHGPIDISGFKEIIDSPEFQRLHHIKQLGNAHYVYPSATHTRFIHSLGAMYLADYLCRQLRKNAGGNSRGWMITDRDIFLVSVAALTHDLGHGPFSHTWDDCVLKLHSENKSREKDLCHEQRSCAILARIVGRVNESCAEGGELPYLADFELTFVQSLIDPEFGPYKEFRQSTHFVDPGGQFYQKEFLYEIVANYESAFDVDKIDYLMRDSLACGIAVKCPVKRIFNSANVLERMGNEVDGEDPAKTYRHICYSRKVCGDIQQVFLERYSMHKRCYQHKTVVATETMIQDFFREANAYFHWDQACLGEELNLEQFCAMDDRLIVLAMHEQPGPERSKEEVAALDRAKEILTRLRTRRLYKFVNEVHFPGLDKEVMDAVDPLDLERHLKRVLEEPEDSRRIRVISNKLKVAGDMKNKPFQKSPAELLWFYSTRTLQEGVGAQECFQLNADEISSVMANQKGEYIIRLYVCDSDEKFYARATRAFVEWEAIELPRITCRDGRNAMPKDATGSPAVSSPQLIRRASTDSYSRPMTYPSSCLRQASLNSKALAPGGIGLKRKRLEHELSKACDEENAERPAKRSRTGSPPADKEEPRP